MAANAATGGTDAYLEVFLNSALSEGEPLGPLALLFLFLARFFPIMQLSPFLGAKVLPNPVKVMFALTLFVIFLPKLLTVTTTPIGFNLFTVTLLMKELFVGFVIGMVISIPFNIVQSAGIIIDHQRGGAALMVNDPTIQNQSSPLGILFNYVLIFIFYVIDAPFIFINTLLKSYDVIPPDQFFNDAFFQLGTPFWKVQMGLLSEMFKTAIELAMPALLIMLMTDLFLGIANRLAPQVQITFLGMALKSLLGLLVVALGWSILMTQFEKQTYLWLNNIVKTLSLFQLGIDK